MAQTNPTLEPRARREEARTPTKTTAEVMLGGSTTEALAGGGAAVLAILALLGVLPLVLGSIATIAVGAALMIEGGSIAARWNRLEEGAHYATAGGGLTVEMLGGAAGVVLGILSLIGIASGILLPIAVLIMGGALLIGAGPAEQIEMLVHHETPGGEHLHQAVNATQGARVLVGLGAGTLGVLVLAGVGVPVVLTLVALLALGAAEFLFGSALGARMARALH